MKTLVDRWFEARLRSMYRENFFLAAICVAAALAFGLLGWLTNAPDNSSARGIAYMGAIIFLCVALVFALQGWGWRRDVQRRTRR
jgi:hypothetical protein